MVLALDATFLRRHDVEIDRMDMGIQIIESSWKGNDSVVDRMTFYRFGELRRSRPLTKESDEKEGFKALLILALKLHPQSVSITYLERQGDGLSYLLNYKVPLHPRSWGLVGYYDAKTHMANLRFRRH